MLFPLTHMRERKRERFDFPSVWRVASQSIILTNSTTPQLRLQFSMMLLTLLMHNTLSCDLLVWIIQYFLTFFFNSIQLRYWKHYIDNLFIYPKIKNKKIYIYIYIYIYLHRYFKKTYPIMLKISKYHQQTHPLNINYK